MKFFWKFYAILFYLIVLSNVFQVFNKESVFGIYYTTTIVFSNWFILPYFLNILNTLISCIACLYVLGFAFDIKNFSQAPPWLFYIHLVGDCIGHSYEIKIIQAGFFQSKMAGFLALAYLTLPILPSYIVLWRMSIKQK